MPHSIVIPTFNRKDELGKCLESIVSQTLLPGELVIIDDGALPGDFLRAWRDRLTALGIAFVYRQKDQATERRGLSESKNLALGLISSDIFFVLDDDVILDRDFCRNIMAVWEKNSSDEALAGVGGIIQNRRRRPRGERLFNLIFGLTSEYSWDINRACFQVWNEEITERSLGFYAHGGVSSYKLSKAAQLRFSTFIGGRTALEDVDFCLRAKTKGWHFIIEPKAFLCHYPSPAERETQFLTGFKESANRKIIFRSQYKKPGGLLVAWFYWANIGWILRQFLAGNFRKGAGMISGLLRA